MQANIEHQLVEAEAIQANLTEEQAEDEGQSSLLDNYDAEKMHDRMMSMATQKAQRVLKRNGREIKRLKNHAGKCLMENRFDGYAYAIKKLRDIYKQPYNDELIRTMWDTSRQSLFDIVKTAK